MSENIPTSFPKELQAHLIDTVLRISGNALHAETITFDMPPTLEFGDVAFRCFDLATIWKKDVNHAAQDLVHAFQPTEYIKRVQAAGPYLNIFFNRQAVATKLLREIAVQREQYGSTESEKPETIVLEYISGNTNKPLHIGHVRNGLIGWSVAELLRSQGHEVVKTDIVNDRGIHIIKSLLAYQKWGKGETPDQTGEKPDHFVGRYYVRFDQEYKKEQSAWLQRQNIKLDALSDQEKTATDAQFRAQSPLWKEAQQMLRDWEAGDNNVRALWKKMNDWAYTGWKSTYDTLGFDFDKHYYESEVYEKGKAIIAAAVEDGTFQKAENGAVFVPLSKHGALPDKVVLRGDGTGLYMTQDLYLANKRYDEFGFDQCLYVIGSEQKLYMQQLFATLRLLNFPAADRLFHLSYGYVSLPEGRMKSREGSVVDADDLIADMFSLASAELEKRYVDLPESEKRERARKIALSALKFHFLSVNREADMVFHPEESLSFEGRTGPYLQYACARAGSILRKAQSVPELETAMVADDSEWRILLFLLNFPRTVQLAAEESEPTKLVNYLVELAQAFSTFYHDQPVLQAKDDVRTTRLAIVQAFQTVIRNGLGMLGIETLEEM